MTTDNFMRRRRICENSHRFTTWESNWKPSNTLARKLKKQIRDRERYAALSPEQKSNLALKRQARLEAQHTGLPLSEIHARWNIT